MVDKWRYKCPECPCHNPKKRVTMGDFRCPVCQATFARRYDKKNDRLERVGKSETVSESAKKVMP